MDRKNSSMLARLQFANWSYQDPPLLLNYLIPMNFHLLQFLQLLCLSLIEYWRVFLCQECPEQAQSSTKSLRLKLCQWRFRTCSRLYQANFGICDTHWWTLPDLLQGYVQIRSDQSSLLQNLWLRHFYFGQIRLFWRYLRLVAYLSCGHVSTSFQSFAFRSS